MSKPNKYNQYTSQEPTDGNPSSRSFKRRAWKDHWQNYLKDEDIIFDRKTRRLAWKDSFKKMFRDMDKKAEPVVSST